MGQEGAKYMICQNNILKSLISIRNSTTQSLGNMRLLIAFRDKNSETNQTAEYRMLGCVLDTDQISLVYHVKI